MNSDDRAELQLRIAEVRKLTLQNRVLRARLENIKADQEGKKRAQTVATGEDGTKYLVVVESRPGWLERTGVGAVLMKFADWLEKKANQLDTYNERRRLRRERGDQ